MPIDVNFFSFLFRTVKDLPGVVECVEQAIDEDEVVHYVKVRSTCQGYGSTLRDSRPGGSGIVYGECHGSQPPHTVKAKSILFFLNAPEVVVEVRNTGTLYKLEWEFEWEGERYQWKRSGAGGVSVSTMMGTGRSDLECRWIGQDEPDITIAQFESKFNKSTGILGSLDFLDHNIQRRTLGDKKGLEIALVFSVMYFVDAWYDAQADEDQKSFVVGPSSDGTALQEELKALELSEQKKKKSLGLDRAANEVVIREQHHVADVVRKARKRLVEPENLYITLTAEGPRQIKKLVSSIPEISAVWSRLHATWRQEMEEWQHALDQLEVESGKPSGMNTRRAKATVPDHIGDRDPQLWVYPVRQKATNSDPLRAAQSAIFKEEQYKLDHKKSLFSKSPSPFVWEGPEILQVHLATISMPSLA